MSQVDDPPQAQGHVQKHIDLIAKHEQEFLARRTPSERLGDRVAAFIGSLTYVSVHVVLFAAWILWNVLPVHAITHFDPFPFPLLDTLFAFEAILVASFILMRQSRISRRAEERDQLMLQILLLSEREITAALGIERQIAERMGLQKLADDREISQLSQKTSIDEMAQIISETLPSE
jgi:uncharacterized membrane protein